MKWTYTEHNWSDTSIYCDDRHIASLSIEDEATEENQDELESRMSKDVKFIVNACNSVPKITKAITDLTALRDNYAVSSNEVYEIVDNIIKKLKED